MFLQLLCSFKASVYLFRGCLSVPLVYVLGNTIWPKVLFVYLKPSVSVPILIANFLSFSFATHYPGHVEETVFREERERDTLRGTEKMRTSNRANQQEED